RRSCDVLSFPTRRSSDLLVHGDTGINGGGDGEGVVGVSAGGEEVVRYDNVGRLGVKGLAVDALDGHTVDAGRSVVGGAGVLLARSEEHTSGLQSRFDLVC